MRYRICKRFDFSASHVLEGLPVGHPCGRCHGHNYSVFVELASNRLNEVGFVLDYRAMQSFKNFIDEKLDHQHLNDVFPHMNPTAELLAGHLLGVALQLLGDDVQAVRVSETDKTWAEFRRP